jgi:dimethylargininase
MIAITKVPSAAMNQCELTYVQREPINVETARSQHTAYCRQLESLGCDVVVLPADDKLADCAFVEDAAIVLDEIAIICQPHSTRMAELPSITEELAKHRSLKCISPPGKIEGGDVLLVGKTILVGLSARTNDDGFSQLKKLTAGLGYQTIGVPVNGCLHLKTACTALDDKTLLVNLDWMDEGALGDFDLVSVPATEPFAANILRIGNSIILPDSVPVTTGLLNSKGYIATTLCISEIQKAEAGLTCLSLIFNSD